MRGLLTPLLVRGGNGLERVAPGVWRLCGNPGRLNIFFLEDAEGGVVQFDAGGRVLVPRIRAALAEVGPLRRVVLGHAHTDHRGAAPYLDAPIVCHPDEVQDASGPRGRYWKELRGLPAPQRWLHRHILQPRLYDGGPVCVADTVREEDEVAGFRVVHLPGHAPGLIALVRDRDRLALTSDAFYTVDALWRDSPPRLPGDAWNWDTERARSSLLRLAELGLSVAWPGHGGPVLRDVGSQLREAVVASRRPLHAARSAPPPRRRRATRGLFSFRYTTHRDLTAKPLVTDASP